MIKEVGQDLSEIAPFRANRVAVFFTKKYPSLHS